MDGDQRDAAASASADQYTAFVADLVRKRDAAVTGRINSGVEDEWIEDEERYQGIDDANRSYVRPLAGNVAYRAKHGGTAPSAADDDNRSRIFLNITRPLVDSVVARLADSLLPIDDRCWAMKPTPIADLDDQTKALLATVNIDEQTALRMQAEVQEESTKACDLMADEIEDHLVECQWHGEVRGVIEDAARIGTGVLRGPVPIKRQIKRWTVEAGSTSLPMRAWSYIKRALTGAAPEVSLQVTEQINPASQRVSAWNCYPDPACGESIHNGGYHFEYATITAKQLAALIGSPGARNDQIAMAIREGPKAAACRRPNGIALPPADGQFEQWIGYVNVAPPDAVALGLLSLEPDGSIDDLPPGTTSAMAILVNDRLVKIMLNPMDTGEFPYDYLAWTARPGMPWGSGPCRHNATPQRMLNAGARAILDNAGLIAGMQLVLGDGVVPADGRYTINGRKLWRTESGSVVDVTKAFYAWVPPSVIAHLMQIVDLALKMSEQTTGIPMLLQGFQTQGQAANTLGGMNMLQSNASSPLRRLAKRFDDYLTTPHIRRYYNWLMQYSDRADIKGDFQVDVSGSSSLIERDAQKQFMYASLNVAGNVQFGINPRKLYAELCRAERVDPEKVQYTDEEYEKLSAPQESELDQAKAALARAQATNEEVRAALTRVETLFSSTNAARNIAADPRIAPAADAIAKSAGYVDQDAPPAIPPVPAMAPPVDPGAPPPAVGELNTSPAFPPRLPEADAGLGTGIEGGQR